MGTGYAGADNPGKGFLLYLQVTARMAVRQKVNMIFPVAQISIEFGCLLLQAYQRKMIASITDPFSFLAVFYVSPALLLLFLPIVSILLTDSRDSSLSLAIHSNDQRAVASPFVLAFHALCFSKDLTFQNMHDFA